MDNVIHDGSGDFFLLFSSSDWWTDFLNAQWCCVAWHARQTKNPLPVSFFEKYVDLAEQTLEVAAPAALASCFTALAVLLPKARLKDVLMYNNIFFLEFPNVGRSFIISCHLNYS